MESRFLLFFLLSLSLFYDANNSCVFPSPLWNVLNTTRHEFQHAMYNSRDLWCHAFMLGTDSYKTLSCSEQIRKARHLLRAPAKSAFSASGWFEKVGSLLREDPKCERSRLKQNQKARSLFRKGVIRFKRILKTRSVLQIWRVCFLLETESKSAFSASNRFEKRPLRLE